MSTIIKEDVLRGKNIDTTTEKGKVDKIMNMIVESSGTPIQTKTEIEEVKLPSDKKKPEEKNTLKQNIFSSEVLIEGENDSDLDEIRNKLRKELEPSNEIESILVDRIISSIWRLKRCLKIERQIMEHESSCIQEYEQGFFKTRKRTNKELTQLKALKIVENNRVVELSKYEAMLERQVYKALNELIKLRRRESRQEKRILKKAK